MTDSPFCVLSARFKIIGIDEDIREGWHLATKWQWMQVDVSEKRRLFSLWGDDGSICRVVENKMGGPSYNYIEIHVEEAADCMIIVRGNSQYKLSICTALSCD